jgi:hypothetical protein
MEWKETKKALFVSIISILPSNIWNWKADSAVDKQVKVMSFTFCSLRAGSGFAFHFGGLVGDWDARCDGRILRLSPQLHKQTNKQATKKVFWPFQANEQRSQSTFFFISSRISVCDVSDSNTFSDGKKTRKSFLLISIAINKYLSSHNGKAQRVVKRQYWILTSLGDAVLGAGANDSTPSSWVYWLKLKW